MAKVLLVEDDNNLREIYQARLMAEGYDIVTAQNGEEALVVAKQNKPDLIIADVMMPRISGFEMLDILRNTDGIKHVRVIMLTALGQADDQKRATSLGADRYLVKSQVTLEDIVNAAKELLDQDGTSTPTPAISTTAGPTSEPESTPLAPAAPNVPAVAHAQIADSVPVAPAPPEPSAAPGSVPTQASVPTQPIVTTAAQPNLTPTDPATTSIQTPATPAPTPTAPPTPAEPATVPAASTVPDPVPATPAPTERSAVASPVPSTTDPAAQALEAEEAALQAQIDSYAKEPATPTPEVMPATDPVEAAKNASNDKAIADAVRQLNTPSEPEPAVPPSIATAPMPAQAAAPTQSTATAAQPNLTPTAPASTDASGNDKVTVAGRKIIQPINDPTVKPDLNALLAKEEAKEPAAPVVNGVPGQPPVQQPSTPTQPFDPNTSL